jgi:hypothetical protein
MRGGKEVISLVSHAMEVINLVNHVKVAISPVLVTMLVVKVAISPVPVQEAIIATLRGMLPRVGAREASGLVRLVIIPMLNIA